MTPKDEISALSLLSGGLDSLLAVKILQEQGVRVVGLTFTTPFFGAENARRGAEQLGIELIVLDITDEHLKMVKNPPHGYGKQMNPCIDCHMMMVRKAGEILMRDGYDCIATGEVLGERPMSQNRQSLDTVARQSGYPDVVLRPLSALLLEPTLPERDGRIDRERLLAIEGRSRKPQMELAQKYGIRTYVQPAGGCLLTDPRFSDRLRELIQKKPDATPDDMWLLRCGRHFRLSSGAKAVVGRNEQDNGRIEACAKEGDALIISDVTPGPVVLLRGLIQDADIQIAVELCASFSDRVEGDIHLELRLPGGEVRHVSVQQRARESFEQMRI